jgi:hypothetical protein
VRLLYTIRPEHWLGSADEPHIMETLLHERGCTEMSTPAFVNIRISFFNCKERAGRRDAGLHEEEGQWP